MRREKDGKLICKNWCKRPTSSRNNEWRLVFMVAHVLPSTALQPSASMQLNFNYTVSTEHKVYAVHSLCDQKRAAISKHLPIFWRRSRRKSAKACPFSFSSPLSLHEQLPFNGQSLGSCSSGFSWSAETHWGYECIRRESGNATTTTTHSYLSATILAKQSTVFSTIPYLFTSNYKQPVSTSARRRFTVGPRSKCSCVYCGSSSSGSCRSITSRERVYEWRSIV